MMAVAISKVLRFGAMDVPLQPVPRWANIRSPSPAGHGKAALTCFTLRSLGLLKSCLNLIEVAELPGEFCRVHRCALTRQIDPHFRQGLVS